MNARHPDSIASSVRIALRQSAGRGLTIDELAAKLNLRGSLALIAALAQLKQDLWIEERAGRFFVLPRK